MAEEAWSGRDWLSCVYIAHVQITHICTRTGRLDKRGAMGRIDVHAFTCMAYMSILRIYIRRMTYMYTYRLDKRAAMGRVDV